jgi:glycosyltransferase involved in cell wall biosynthesis
VVQQEWVRQAFKQMLSVDKVVVSLPVQPEFTVAPLPEDTGIRNEKMVFFYPSTPMIHKNYEVICEAASALKKAGVHNFEVILTFNGSENKYAEKIYDKYKSLNSLRFVGFLTREKVEACYHNCNCLLFPSKIESWGLPVSEAKEYGKAVLVSDLPYAKETVGKYDKAKFFDPDNAGQLAGYMKDFIQGNLVYDKTEEIKYEEPFTRNWDELIQFLFQT